MSASKARLRWNEVPESTRVAIEALVGGRVANAENRRADSRPASQAG